jgi:hypothetical protein
MSSLTNINNNSSVVNIGRTTPVSPGKQPAEKSIPVVVASDQEPVPVVEQNKIQSEVALSLLGIPRSEVALGIFADVNTYDVNPTEWSAEPEEYSLDVNNDGWGIKHLPEEAGALIEAPKDKVAVLTSKRFFRYQPGRVSSATFGVKSSNSPSSGNTTFDLNPSIRKYGIFDKYDGYYWETKADSTGDNFCVVRRTQSLLRNNPLSYGLSSGQQIEDHAVTGKAPNVYTEPTNEYPTATKFLTDNRFKIIEVAFADALDEGNAAATALAALTDENKAKCKRDMNLALEAYILDLQYGGNAHSIINATTYRLAAVPSPTVEELVHTKLGVALRAALTGASETAAADRVYNTNANTELVYWTLLAINNSTTRPNSSEINAANYGTRSAISTVFAIYSKFLAYVGSEYNFDSTNTNIIVANYSTSSTTLSAEEIKYRCYRDIAYILKGYAEDLEFGGNASTIYNAKRYYFNGIQVFSQTPGGATGEIKRHQFLQKLLTENGGAFNIPTVSGKSFLSLTSLFPNVFNSVARTKIITLSNLIIDNFTLEYTGDIVYGSGGNYGDLVVLRDGLIMTHAAVFDPSLLKETKNVVVKPGFVKSTTSNTTLGISGTNTLSITSNSGISIGLSVTSNATGIPVGTTVVSVNSTAIDISANLTSTIAAGSILSFGDSILESSQDEFVVGQYVNFYGTAATANANSLVANRLYRVEKVRGAKSNILSLSDATTKNQLTVSITGTTLTIVTDGNPDNVVLAPGTRLEGKGLADNTTVVSGAGTTWTINTAPANNLTNVVVTKLAIISPDVDPSDPTLIYINPNVPFVFPTEYFTGRTNDPERYKRPDGMFPLMYAANGVLPAISYDDFEKVGFIDTSIVFSNPATLKSQIDTVNLIYNNWIKQNVDPKYYSVYEYRVPRSRFSTDQLNGQTNFTVYSDVATGETGKVFPGQTVLEDGLSLQTVSVWDIDFTKVTMLKVEFSWYGAVGALFLAYVPVGNGQARWVRVHHLRASNQLKISSLGNATLPITYLVYGGGSVSRLGILDTGNKGYTRSNHVVKYGASYYIDGGDRGTVRLYSHSTMESVDVYGSSYALGNLSTSSDSIGTYIDVTGVSGLPTDKRFFMKSKLLTNSRADQNVEIVWVSGNKLYLNKGSLNSSTGLTLIANRPSVVFGLKAKDSILNSVGTAVRNRVQVYPTKLSTSSMAPFGVTDSPKIKLQLLKTPIYQPVVTTNGSFTLTSAYNVTPNNLPLTTSSTTYLARDGDGIYGWFRANVGTVFGYLYRLNGSYYFTLLETYSEQITLIASVAFLAEGRFDFTGTILSSESEDTLQKERLSSVFVSTQIQSPIPKTGVEVASFFLKEGSDMFDLLSYFDYNKDYLSFPLTDKIESIYLAASSIQASNTNPIAEISSSLTWEEQ